MRGPGFRLGCHLFYRVMLAQVPLIAWLIPLAGLLILAGFALRITRRWRARWVTGAGCWQASGVRFRTNEAVSGAVSPQARRALDFAAGVLFELRFGTLAVAHEEPPPRLRWPRTAVEVYPDGGVPPDSQGAREAGVRLSERALFCTPLWRIPLVEDTPGAGHQLLHEVLRHTLVFQSANIWDGGHAEQWAAELETAAKRRLDELLASDE